MPWLDWAVFLRRFAFQVVHAGPGVGVEVAQRPRLGLQGLQQRDQHAVLEHVAKLPAW